MTVGPTNGNRPVDVVMQDQTSSTNTSGSQNRAADMGVPPSNYEDPRKVCCIVQHEYDENRKISTTRYPAGTVPVNTRRESKVGERLDNALRQSLNYLQKFGLAPSHAQGTRFGAPPADAKNVDPGNTQQNGSAGNWNKAEGRDIGHIEENWKLDRERVVETVYRADGRMLYRQSIVTANGSIVNNGQNVYYGEFSTLASRTAEANGGLKPKEGGRLDKTERASWKVQLEDPYAQSFGDQYRKVVSMRQNLLSMTPAEEAEYRQEAKKLLIQGPQKPEPPTTPRQSSTGTSVLNKVGKVAGPAALVAPTIIEAAFEGIEAYKDGKAVAGVAGATAVGAGNGIVDTFAPGARSGYSNVIGEGDLTGLDRMLNGVDYASGTATAVGGAAMLVEAAGVVTLPAEIPTAIATGLAGATNLAVNVAKAGLKATGLAGKDQDGGWIYNGIAAGSRAVSYVAESGIERVMHLFGDV